MKFLVRNARGKIIEDAEEKRDDLIQTFQVIGHVLFISCMFVQAIYCFRNIYTTSITSMQQCSIFVKLQTCWLLYLRYLLLTGL